MEEKFLTSTKVIELGLKKVEHITVDMLDGYTKIEDYAFEYCTNLNSIEIPNSVTYIGDSTFYYCISLKSIVIPNSVTVIEDYAFYNCSSLTSVTIPNSVTSIGDYAFSGCYSLESVTIPKSVKSIGDYAFYDCNKLASVYISDIAAWCKISFDCSDSNPLCYAHNLYLNGTLVTDLVIPNSVTSIGEWTFLSCSSLTSVTIGNSVTSIGGRAFSGCYSLESVTIPKSVKSIGYFAFGGCGSLKNIIIGNKEYKNHEVVNGKCKAYKGFNADMTCRDFQYKEGKTYEFDGEPKLCKCGFHACLKLSDVFNYYSGKIGEDFVVYEVELEGVSDERNKCDSKIVASKITIGKRIL